MLLLLVRVYFALSPSYLHPDENFQGPEVFAGMSPFEFTPRIGCAPPPPDSLPRKPQNKCLRPPFFDRSGPICDWQLIPLDRADLLVSSRVDMGVHICASDPQRLSAMDRLRLADERAQMVLQRGRQ